MRAARVRRRVQGPPAPAIPMRRPAARRGAPAPFASLSAIPASVQPKCEACAAEDREREMPVQPRLEVGPAGDRYEREADAIADRVMAMRDADATAAAPAPQRACSACSAIEDEPRARRLEAEEDEEDRARGRDAGGESLAASGAQLTQGGSPLPDATRGFFEARMGRDLGGVRVHEGGGARTLNESISARAFTYRNHIWLGSRERAAPSFTMAHELAHVMQQTAPGPVGPMARRRPAASAAQARVQRAGPAAAAPAAAMTITAAVGKCIIGAVGGAVLDAGVQAVLQAIREGITSVASMTLNKCSLIASAVVGCVAAPISARYVEPGILARNPSIAARQGTALGWALLRAAAAARMAVPKYITEALLKLGCISASEALELGGGGGDDPGPAPAPPGPGPAPAPNAPNAPSASGPAAPAPVCEKRSGDIRGNERILMKVNTTDPLDSDERTRLDVFADGLRGTKDKVIVHGLASEDGPTEYNDRLSCSRAVVGRQLLVSRGVEASRILGTYQHGEVPGPKHWQRSVVYELVRGEPVPGGGNAPAPAVPGGDRPAPSAPGNTAPPAAPLPGPGTTPAPTPGGTVAPRVTLKKLRFTSDHGLLRDYDADWALGGKVPDPEWTADSPDGRAAPISQTRATPLAAEAEIDVEPATAAAVPVTLHGFGTDSVLNMRGTAVLGGGKGQKIAVNASELLPDEIWRLSGQSIHWASEIGGQKQLVGASHEHEVLITHGTPKDPTTTKRLRKAIELTSLAGNNPHDIIKQQVASYGFYNLKNPIWGEPWQFADVIPPTGPGSDCQSIIRFIMVVNGAIGLPGVAKGLAVYADPKNPAQPKSAPLIYSGGAEGSMSDYPDHWLIDGGGNCNNYEATLHYVLDGSTYFPDPHFERFYPGGIPGAGEGKKSLLDVLHVFTKMAHTYYITDETGAKSFRADEIFCYRGRADCDKVVVKPRGT